MGKTIVSLVSGQTIPNVMFIKANGDAERLVFITTEGMEKRAKTDWILKSVGVNSGESIEDRIIVSEGSISEIQNKLSQYAVFDRNGEILVNLTGGNKIMSLAVHEFFKRKSLQNQNITKMYYLNVGGDKFDMVFPSEQKNCIFSGHCNLKEYLTAYSIDEEKTGKLPLMKFEKTWEFYSKIFEPERNTIEIIQKKIGSNLDKYKKLLEQLSDNDKKDVLELCKKVFDDHEFTKSRIKYLTGGWFEEYIYFLIKRGLKLNEEQICLNLVIKDKSLSGEAAANELDVIFIHKNKINIIECKTGLKGVSGKSILGDVLYKQSALKKIFGLTAKSFLFLPDVLSGNEEHKKRAKIYGIDIVDDKEMLLDEGRFRSEFLERFA